jgi:hypothetical protein
MSQAPSPDEPEYFPAELLRSSLGTRQAYFEQQCLIEHPRLLDALDAIVQTVCPIDLGASERRPGTMVLVIGPSRVGKTTRIRLLEERLARLSLERMQAEPGFIPFASMSTVGPENSRFDWLSYYRAVLRSLRDPFVDIPRARIPNREVRQAMEAALLHRKPLAVIVDEAHHLAVAASGSSLQNQLNHLKYFENLTGVSHILVGTYEMRPFRRVNAQLACRSLDVHFSRYDAASAEDAQVFRSIVWALQRQFPVPEEPHLVEQWEFLYARSIGCIGLLKLHLNRALTLALAEHASTVTLTHLRKAAMPESRVEAALRNALESEAELTESPGADERLLALLGLRGSASKQATEAAAEQKPPRKPRPGKRSPQRDTIGEATQQESLPEEAAG